MEDTATVLNKKETAEYLGKSKQSIEAYIAKGKLKPIYVAGPFGREVRFSKDDVESLKQFQTFPFTRETAAVVAPSVQKMAAAGLTFPVGFAEVVEALNGICNRIIFNGEEPSLSDLDVKLVLSVAEAAALSGIPRGRIFKAIAANGLKASREWGRGWKVKRSDLDAWVRAL
jgi:excisionase family DNA binding protein